MIRYRDMERAVERAELALVRADIGIDDTRRRDHEMADCGRRLAAARKALVAAHRVRVSSIEAERNDVVADLAAIWWRFDLLRPVEVTIAVSTAQSATKDGLALGLLSGVLELWGDGLTGVVELTALGRLMVRRYRRRTGHL